MLIVKERSNALQIEVEKCKRVTTIPGFSYLMAEFYYVVDGVVIA